MEEPVVVIRESEDGLYQQKWTFFRSGHKIILHRYQKSRREKDLWKITHFYDAENKEPYGNWVWLRESRVPWDDNLRNEVAAAILSKFTIGKPSDFKKKRRP